MCSNNAVKILRNTAFAGATLLGAQPATANDNAESFMTAETIMREMTVDERFLYVSGIVEGFAYRRLESDTAATGAHDESGMACINQWFYRSGVEPFQLIQAAFNQYPEHFPSTIVSVLINRECGE